MKHHRPGDFKKNRNSLFCFSGGWKPNIKVSTGLVPSESDKGRTCPRPLSSAGGLSSPTCVSIPSSFCMWKWKLLSRVQLWDPKDCMVNGILQARILERVAFPFSRDLSNPGIKPRSPACRQILYQLGHQRSPHFNLMTSLKMLSLISVTFWGIGWLGFQYMNFGRKIQKRQRNQRSNCQHLLDHKKSKRVPEKHLLLFYWLCQSLWLCRSQQTVENSSRDGTIRPPYLPPEKSVCKSRSNS